MAAAADLQLAFSEIARLFEQQSACRVVLTFGSTGQLSQQIEQGLPVDIFAAANVSYLDGLRAKHLLVADSQQVYARGHIVLAVHQQPGVAITQLDDLRRPEVRHIAIANPTHAPYGAAARQALERSGLWDELQPKIVLGENVRQALQYVETGNAEAGIVALSTAHGVNVNLAAIDEALYDPLDQALAIVAGSRQIDLARDFIAFLGGPDARAVMKKFGFVLPGE